MLRRRPSIASALPGSGSRGRHLLFACDAHLTAVHERRGLRGWRAARMTGLLAVMEQLLRGVCEQLIHDAILPTIRKLRIAGS